MGPLASQPSGNAQFSAGAPRLGAVSMAWSSLGLSLPICKMDLIVPAHCPEQPGGSKAAGAVRGVREGVQGRRSQGSAAGCCPGSFSWHLQDSGVGRSGGGAQPAQRCEDGEWRQGWPGPKLRVAQPPHTYEATPLRGSFSSALLRSPGSANCLLAGVL